MPIVALLRLILLKDRNAFHSGRTYIRVRRGIFPRVDLARESIELK